MAAEKPSVLIIGGMGYIGRFLARHIHENQLASEVRLVDKKPPEIVWLAPEFEEACSRKYFMQKDASKEDALQEIFNRPDGKEWDYVFNCGGETRYSQGEERYRALNLALSVAVAKEAAKRKVRCFIELSTGSVYKPNSSPSKEGDKLKPWSQMAVVKQEAEEALSKIEGLNLVIARLAYVYGPYATQELSTSLCLARVYQSFEEDLKFLWTKELRMNSVHIDDVVRALWAMATWYDSGKPNWDAAAMGETPIFNVVDKGATSQGTIADIIGELFNIKTTFQGQILSNFARFNMDTIVDDINEDVLDPWGELLTEAGITKSIPLSPFTEKELLKDTDLSMDGSRLEQVVGFQYEKPVIAKELVAEVIESYKKMKWWP
ncbi:hypothetical protein SLS62_008920 [Diatrype stigma]|uniref:NAD-dependent epimerase/dehydratase domain-containing protein n=1 Tax=Diatrype stigma TaxID=117547 RepID=A0AAN9UH43_9PEZI